MRRKNVEKQILTWKNQIKKFSVDWRDENQNVKNNEKFTSHTRRLIYKTPKNSQKAITKKEQNDNPNIHSSFRLLSQQMSLGKDQIKSIDVYIKQYDKMRNT